MKKSQYKKLTLFFLLIISCFGTKAQTYVTIPDANFAAWLNANYPSCMSGNQMDINCPGITNEDSLSILSQNISDLTGIEYFTGLAYLNCSDNPLTGLPGLPTLPPNLVKLYCYLNQLSSLPALPPNLLVLYCTDNFLTSLPSFPSTLSGLYCSSNQLTVLPVLPNSLKYLLCDDNQLTSLPPLPSTLLYLYCQNNMLTTLPSLPDYLSYFDCRNNNISCFPVFPSIYSNVCAVSGNPFSCLPNYVSAMDAATLAYPLCLDGDPVNNPSACPGADGIAGYTFFDNNSNCIRDSGDSGLIHVPIRLYDNNNNFLKKTYSLSNSIYHLQATAGNYKVEIDTAGLPFTVQCLSPGIDSSVTLSVSNSLVQDVNFEIACEAGFDVGVQSVLASGLVFPGQLHNLQIIAGDLSKWYHLICSGTAGLSGQVQVTVTGPVTYIGITSGALTPSIAGNVFTYAIADYSLVDIMDDFGLIFQTNSTAQAGDFICVNVTVTPSAGDNNTSNNTYQFCYQVVNSYDPNNKEVTPLNVLPGFMDYFTYTIHFQNTGNATAINILLSDTLDNNLDIETFQVINFSHINAVSLDSNVLRFRFSKIMLPDSATDEPGSKGFVQYRIKPKANLPLGTQIKNTAYIYFDYNAPIITNTTVNEYLQTISVIENISTFRMNIFPNPCSGKFIVEMKDEKKKMQDVELKIYNILGEEILNTQYSIPNTQIDISFQSKGIYFLKITGDNKVLISQKIIIE